MEYISLVLTIVFAVFLGLGFLLGFKRGLKRTMIRGIWLISIVVLLIFLSTMVTTKLFDINFNMNIGGQIFPTIRDYITSLFEANLPMEGADYSALVNLVVSVGSIALNVVVFLVGYWVLKIITLVLYWFTNIFIFAGERRRKRRAKKEKQKYKVKKYRLLGALTGCVLGLMSFCVTMTPVVGYMSIIKNLETHTATEEDGVISSVMGDNYSALITAYDNSFPIKFMDAMGLDSAINLVFDGVSSTTINDQKVVLSDELIELADVYMIAKDLSIPDFSVATQSEVEEFLNTSDKMVDAIFESKLVSASADTIIPFAAKYARQMTDTSEFKPHVLAFYNAFFDQFEGLNALTTKQEVKGAINVVRILNDRNLLLPILQDNAGDMVEFLKLNLTKPAVDEIMESLFALDTVNNLAPAMVNFLLGEGADRYDYEYSTENEILSATLKAGATSILYSTIELLGSYDSNLDTKVEINNTTIGALGSILDEIKFIVSQKNFKSIVDAIEPKLEEMALNALGDSVPQFLKDSVSEMINNISEINGFKSSFTSLYSAYETAKTEFDNAYIEADEKYDVELMDFEKFGKALNTFQNCDLVGRSLFLDTMKNAIDYYIEKAETNIAEDGSFKFTFDDVVVNNLEILKGTGLDWSVELPVYKETAGLLANLLQDSDNIMNRLKSDADPTIESLGYELEHNLKTSALFSGSDRLFVSDILEVADIKINTSEDEDLNNNLSTLLQDAKYNVLNEPTLNWETEFKHLKTIIKVEFEDTSDESILSIANKLDTIVFDTLDENDKVVLKASSIFKQDMINNFIADYMDTLFGDVDEEDSLYSTIQQIKTSFENETITSYTYEFDAILKLKSINEILSEDDFELKTGGVNIGIRIDEALAVGVEDGVDPKVVVTKSLVNNLIKEEIDNFMSGYSDDLETEITQIKDGFNDDIELYEVEFTALVCLVTVADTATADGFDFNDKTSAQDLGKSIDDTLNYVTVNEVDYYSTIITSNLINGYLKRVINDKVDLGEDSDFKEVLTTITGKKNQDGTYAQGRIDTFNSTYEKEFGYLSQLIIVSNNFTDITINTINVKNNVTNSTIAEEFDGSDTITDPLKNSYLVGDSLLLAIDNVLEIFTEDEDNQDYSAILTEVNSNYSSTKSQVKWISNSAGTTTYTAVIDALVEIEDALNGDLTKDITDISQVSSLANTYDSALAELQENMLLAINGTNELAQYAMNKVLDKLTEEKAKLDESVNNKFDDCINYANNYIEFLTLAKTNAPTQEQPYVSESVVNVYKTDSAYQMTEPTSGEYTIVQVNNPFAKVGNLIDSALGN